jgi:hypothetical protein
LAANAPIEETASKIANAVENVRGHIELAAASPVENLRGSIV